MPAGRTLAEWLDYQQDLHPLSIDLGLESIDDLLADLAQALRP